MVIPSGLLFFVICTALSFGVMVVVFRILKKNETYLSLPLRILAFVLFFSGPIGSVIVLMYCSSTITEITTSGHKTLTAIGSFEYEAPDGQLVDIDLDNEYDGYIVNLTDSVMIKDLLMYGMGINFDNGTIIPPHSYSDNNYSTPDYYPWQMPPSEISVNSTLGMGTKTWVHYESVSIDDIGE